MRKFFLSLSLIFILMIGAMAQRTITGKVVGTDGAPLQGATVEASDKSATFTSEDGSYKLKVGSTARILLFTLSEYSSETVSIGNKTVINVTLTSNKKNLQEVVVVGYGTQRKKEITGNYSSVKGSAVADKPVQSFEQALAGKATGVQITIPNGVLNTPPVFRIRGTNSASLSSYPLIVVDGIISPTGDFSSTSSAGNALASINPNDIESIDIAKDGAATAIYGSRAANGVVFITTKKGKPGKARVSYNGSVSWAKVYGLPDILNAQEYTDYKNLAAANNGNINTTNPAGSGYTKFGTATDANGNLIDTRWYDYVYRQGFSHNHNLNVSGGSDNTTYYFSVGYTDQEGILKKNNFKRKNVLFNIDSKLNNVLTTGGKISYSNEENLAASTSGSLPGEAFNTAGLGRIVEVNAPNVSPYKNDGSYNINANNIVGPMNNSIAQVGFYNPVVLLDLNRSNSESNHIQSSVYLQLKPLKWITLRSQYAIDYLFVNNEIFQTPVHGDGFSVNGNATSSLFKAKAWGWNTTAQFDYTFANNHSVSALAGHEENRRTTNGFGINRQQIPDPAYQIIQAGTWSVNNATGLAFGENFFTSYFGRINYDFKKKYFLAGSIRQDDYSAFAIKRSTFWGASGGWEISKENFWGSSRLDRTFSSFKIRGSYGKVGNTSGIGDYVSFSTYSSGLYGGNPTLAFNQAGNTNLQWETSKKTDVGFSFGLFKDRLTGDFAYYKNDISGLILNVPQSPSTGLPNSIPTNIGAMYNKGIEILLSGVPVQSKNFTWTSTFTFTTNKNEVTALAPGLPEVLSSTSGLETVSRTAVGYSLGYLWLVRDGGVDPGTGKRIFLNKDGNPVLYQYYVPAGQFQYTNPDGTQYKVMNAAGQLVPGTITQAVDGVMFGNVLPKQYGGWENTFRYKDFDVNIQLTYQLGFWVYYGSHAGLHDQRFWNNERDVLNAWNKPGDVTTVPKPVYLDNISNGSGLPLSYNAFKGDFVKVKNVEIGYNFPTSLLSRAKMNYARFYVSGQNLHIFTKYPGPDPEVSSNGNGTTNQGIDRNTIANSRIILVGFKVTF